ERGVFDAIFALDALEQLPRVLHLGHIARADEGADLDIFKAGFAEQVDQFDALLDGVDGLFDLKAFARAFLVEFDEFRIVVHTLASSFSFSAISTIAAPRSIMAPSLTAMLRAIPAVAALMGISSFIDSRMATVSPIWTSSPSETSSLMIRPVSGEVRTRSATASPLAKARGETASKRWVASAVLISISVSMIWLSTIRLSPAWVTRARPSAIFSIAS